jgi:translocation and assembly module TamA
MNPSALQAKLGSVDIPATAAGVFWGLNPDHAVDPGRCLSALALAWLLLFPASPAFAAAILKYSVSGIDAAQTKNVQAWLGKPPETESERLNFVSSAQDRVTRALQALGYYQADIAMDMNRDNPVWKLKIRVTANEPVRVRKADVQLAGEAAADPAFLDLLSRLALSPGDAFSHGNYERLKSELVAMGQEQGYFDARFTRSVVEVSIAQGTADIALHYASGQRYRFGAVQFDEQQITPGQVEALSRFEDGDPFDLAGLQQFQGDLQRTGYYSNVILRPRLDDAVAGQVPISLALAPAARHSFNVGVGYRTDTEERASVTWRTPKINAAGHSQETRLEYSPINPSGRISYHIPLSHPLEDVLHLTARVEDNEFGDLDSRQMELGVRREFRRKKWVDSYLVRGLNESWNALSESYDNFYVLPGFTLSRRDLRGSLTDPSHGVSQFYQIEGGSEQLGSDIDLVRAYARFGYITTLVPRHRLLARVEVGTAVVADGDRAELAPSLNFFAGGSQSIRGFAYQSIGNTLITEEPDGSTRELVVGGDKLLTTSLEYQYDYNDTWRTALFSDFGDAFDTGEFEGHYSVGFGVHYLTVVGAIKAQVAYPLSDDNPAWRFHLDIGAQF